MQYSVLASAFKEELEQTMRTMYRTNILATGLSPLEADLMLRDAVHHLVQGLQAHLHDRLAVLLCIHELTFVMVVISVRNVHPGLAARPSVWTLLKVLSVYPGDDVLCRVVMRLIKRFWTELRRMYSIIDQQDTVVLSAAQLPRAIAIVDACLAALPPTNTNTPALTKLGLEVCQWIASGSLLTGETYAE